ncbi:MAG: GAF domain-containing protein [Candidatus Rokubacteria bacterium]|nr:GAF domain-containing protein [Candidatus Rokubacteria bacterium]
MTLHSALPLIALFLNAALVGVSILRNPASRLNRVFAYFATALALWNFGVFMLRRAPDEASAYLWEVVIHVGVIAIPVFYYHFVLIFLDSTTRRRPALALAYGLAIIFSAINASGSALFMTGVKSTHWGWAPATGPLYTPFFLYFNAFMIYGLCHLAKAYRTIDSSFRRNRVMLVLLATFISLIGGFVDFARFILTRFLPAADQAYPLGIPGNMILVFMIGLSIVRYRMFDVDVALKKAAIYCGVAAVVTSLLVGLTWTLEQQFRLEETSALWIVIPLGLIMTLFLSPFGHGLESQVERLIFSKRRGCYDTLLNLSNRMSAILDSGKLVDTLVRGLARGIPLTHCVVMLYDRAANLFVPYREESTTGEESGIAPIRADSSIAQWLAQADGVLVKEEVKINRQMAVYFEAVEGELEQIPASLLVPLKIENKLTGILLLGEKLSGEVFDDQELEVLSVVANQAAISLENARLYEQLGSSNARLLQASQLKSQFLASMSHELRTPLNSIIGFSKVLLNRIDGDLTDRQDSYVRSVHSSSMHLLELINSVLDISRIEAGKQELDLQEIDLHDLMDECIESSAPLARGKPLKIEKDAPLELPRLRGDRTKVKQVLLNLLSNAVKFTATGRVMVRVRPEPDAVHVSVADTGIGIREADLPRLFEPFQRLDSPLARDAGGTGLGLAISKKFVELHRGRIWAESRENHGSTFHFVLPLTPAS